MAELMAAGVGCGVCFGVVFTGLFVFFSFLTQPTAPRSARDAWRWRQYTFGRPRKRRG